METGPESGEHACEREKGLICDAPGCGVRLHDRVKVRRPTHEAIAGSCGLLGAVTCAARKRHTCGGVHSRHVWPFSCNSFKISNLATLKL